MKLNKLIQALGAVVIGFTVGALDYVYAAEQTSDLVYVNCIDGVCYDEKTGEAIFESDRDGRFLTWIIDEEAELIEEENKDASH